MTTPDPLLERLRQLPRPAPDDIASARTLARAEAAFAAARNVARPRVGWSVPAALALWGALYVVGAARELTRLYPTSAEAKPAVAANHRGPSVGGDQFMLNAISNVSARTMATMTIVPPLPTPCARLLFRAWCHSAQTCLQTWIPPCKWLPAIPGLPNELRSGGTAARSRRGRRRNRRARHIGSAREHQRSRRRDDETEREGVRR